MGLGNFVPDDDEGESSTGQREYDQFTREEFEEFLDEQPYSFELVELPAVKELVYDHKPMEDDMPRISLRLFSTIDKRTGVVREKGSDAIRAVLFDTRGSGNLTGERKTLRIKSWRSNLAPKIERLAENAPSYVHECPRCKTTILRPKEGQYGSFYGCPSYPNCQVMLSETKKGSKKGRLHKGDDWVYGDNYSEVVEKLKRIHRFRSNEGKPDGQ